MVGHGNPGLLVEDSGELLETGGGALEGVVELAHLGERLEETAQVQHERCQHADLHAPADHLSSAVEQDRRRRQVADEHDAGPVDAEKLERARHRGPVALREVLEDLVVACLTPERVHGPDAAQRLGELHDHEGHGASRVAVGRTRLPLVPARQIVERDEAGQAHESEAPVEHEQDHPDAHDREDGGDQGVQPQGEHVVDGVEVHETILV